MHGITTTPTTTTKQYGYPFIQTYTSTHYTINKTPKTPKHHLPLFMDTKTKMAQTKSHSKSKNSHVRVTYLESIRSLIEVHC
jgi:hypothetical protein